MISDNEVVLTHTDDPLKEFEDVFEITQGDGKKLLLKEQIKEYRRMPIDTAIWDYPNPLTFWNTCIAERLQLLSVLARAILSVPDTSAGSERLFSQLGNTLTAKRSRLAPDRACDLMLVKEGNKHFSRGSCSRSLVEQEYNTD